MTKMTAGSSVRNGYWLNLKTWTLHPVARDGEALPGSFGETYVRVPLLLAFVLTPVIGLAFVMFLPFIGFYLTLRTAMEPIVRIFRHSAGELASTMTPGWQPGEAHLTGKRAEEASVEEKGPPAAEGAELEKLQKEIEEKRGAGK